MVNKLCLYRVAVLVLPLLFFSNTLLYAGAADSCFVVKGFSVGANTAMSAPLVLKEYGGDNLQRRSSWLIGACLGYTHLLYRQFSATISLGTNIYSYKYVADVMINGTGLVSKPFSINYTERFYCVDLGVSLSRPFKVFERRLVGEAGVNFIKTPSLLLSHEEGVQSSSGGASQRFFRSEVLFDGSIQSACFAKLGFPVLKNSSKLLLSIVYNYYPGSLGSGNFYFKNTTTNSYGTVGVRPSGIGLDIKYFF